MLVDGDKPTGKGNYDQEGTKRQREGEEMREREREVVGWWVWEQRVTV